MGSRNEGCSKAPAAGTVVAFTHKHTFSGKLAKLGVRRFVSIQHLLGSFFNLLTYSISSNSSRPLNRPRPRLDHRGNSIVSEIQRALELTSQFN